MKNRTLITASLLALLFFGGCDKSRNIYDLDNGVDREVVLFGKSLTVPVGSAGPFTLELAMGSLGNALSDLGLAGDMLSTDEEGRLLFSFQNEVFSSNFFELALSMEDNEEPFVWTPDVDSAMPSLGILFSYLHFRMHHQRLALYASSGMKKPVPFKGHVDVLCMDMDTSQLLYQDEDDLEVTLPSYGRGQLLGGFTLPESCSSATPAVMISDAEVTLPAHFRNVIDDGIFSVVMDHQSNVSVEPDFDLSLPTITIPVNLNLGAVGFNDAQVTLELESTLPIRVTILEMSVPDQENLSVSAEGVLEGGSPEAPASSTLTLNIKTLDGQTIPDISSLVVNAKIAAVPGMEDVILSVRQGLYLKHSSMKVTGGITLFGHED